LRETHTPQVGFAGISPRGSCNVQLKVQVSACACTYVMSLCDVRILGSYVIHHRMETIRFLTNAP
jgi:hypothetical protein